MEGHTGSSLAELSHPAAVSELLCDTGDTLGQQDSGPSWAERAGTL